MRTARKIVDQTEELALRFLEMDGYVPSGDVCGFVTRSADSPRSRMAWEKACEAQRILTNTDPLDALVELEDE